MLINYNVESKVNLIIIFTCIKLNLIFPLVFIQLSFTHDILFMIHYFGLTKSNLSVKTAVAVHVKYKQDNMQLILHKPLLH